jgi:hypothetical protein
MAMMQDELLEIRKASAGLEYPSESEAPFDIVIWPSQPGSTAKAQVLAHAGLARAMEEVSLDDFFAELVASEEGDRYRKLRQALESTLKNLEIFRVGAGEVKVDIYLIGQAPSGAWAGLHTTSVET